MLRAPYADQASAALDNRPEMAKLKAELKSIATPGGGTLLDWVKSFIAAGDEIDNLLRRRATLLATSENAAATGPLRGATIGLLGRFRDALRDEIEQDGGLPADHETRLFAYLDKLNADRERALRGRAAPAPAPAPETTDPPSPPAAPTAASPAVPDGAVSSEF